MAEKFVAVIAPAKRLESGVSEKVDQRTNPVFIEEADYLVNKLRKMSARKLSSMMNVSAEIADLNVQRFADWDKSLPSEKSDAALLSFKGDVYRGMGAEDFNKSEMSYANSHIRILSGLYGLLKPLDSMMPYRLEMGTSFAVTPKKKNLYQYWDQKILNHLEEELGEDGVILNLASNEYFKALPKKSLKNRVIDFKFLDLKNGEYKSMMTYAKLARGYMCRYIVKNKLKNLEDLKGFNLKNYVFRDDLSSENELVFSRDVVEL